MIFLKSILFGRMPDGTAVEQYTLASGPLRCDILTLGATVRALRVPARGGRSVDVVLGFDTLENCCRQDKYLGVVAGRCANRIGGARFTLGGREYRLAANDGTNHLHGGPAGFHTKVWTVTDAQDDALTLFLLSPDGEEGYPGSLRVSLTYRLTGNALSLDFLAVSDCDTLCNLTSHAYFNLSGHDSGSVLDQSIAICADRYTPTDADSIPTGALAPVEGTPMDLRRSTPIGAHIDDPFPQLVQAGGYDHNFVLRGRPGVLRHAASAFSPVTGVALDVDTDRPGLQFYTGNCLDGCPAGKGGAAYGRRCGFCLETQDFPDAVHHPDFPSCVLPAQTYYQTRTVWRFSVLPEEPTHPETLEAFHAIP